MNWLAHIFLSEPSIEFQLGNILADPLKGKAWQGADQQLLAGMAMHKSIDCFTDQHTTFLKSKSRLRDKGYLKSVIIDLVYDHLLTVHWQRFATTPLNDFLDDFYVSATDVLQHYPPEAKHFIETLIASDRLRKYSTLDDLEQTLLRIDHRLSDNMLQKETASGYINEIRAEIQSLERDFLAFFPSLLTHVEEKSNHKNFHHWRKNL